MTIKRAPVLICAVAALAIGAPRVLGAGADTNRINGDDARTLLGNGTGVVIGFVDSGIDASHPALAGIVTGGLPRLVAQANFVPSEPGNTGDDVSGHGTAVAGQALSRDATRMAVATDARYVNARVLDSTTGFASDSQVIDGTGFAIAHGANLINFSLAYNGGDGSGNSSLSFMADYLTFGLRIPVTVAAGNSGNDFLPIPQGPADAYNVFSVGGTSQATNYGQVASFSSFGPAPNGRNTVNIVAPGDQLAVPAAHTSGFGTATGTSFSSPAVAGILAAQVEYGHTHSLSTDPLVLRATVLNSAEKVNDRTGATWAPRTSNNNNGVFTATSPLNRSAGAGQIDGLRLFQQYSPGEMSPGNVAPVGWDMANITGTSSLDYDLGMLAQGTSLTATLTWFRHVGWTDDDLNGVLDSGDGFSLLEAVDNLDLKIFRDQTLIAQSTSLVDTIEHIYLTGITAGDYLIRVTRLSGGGTNEDFGLAWFGTAVPEPCTILISVPLAWIALSRTRRLKP